MTLHVRSFARARRRRHIPTFGRICPNIFLQKMIRNDVLSDRKVLQKFIGIGKGLFTSFLVWFGPFKKQWLTGGKESWGGGGVAGGVEGKCKKYLQCH